MFPPPLSPEPGQAPACRWGPGHLGPMLRLGGRWLSWSPSATSQREPLLNLLLGATGTEPRRQGACVVFSSFFEAPDFGPRHGRPIGGCPALSLAATQGLLPTKSRGLSSVEGQLPTREGSLPPFVHRAPAPSGGCPGGRECAKDQSGPKALLPPAPGLTPKQGRQH